MGDFRIKIDAVGGHGCRREPKEGEAVYGCGRQDCPDCLTAKFVADLRRAGAEVKSATFTHWPHDSPSKGPEIVDDYGPTAATDHSAAQLLMLVRAPGLRAKGSFTQ